MAAEHRRAPATNRVGGALAALLWLGLGLGVGWMAGLLADHLGVRADHLRSLVGLCGCGVVLIGWISGTRLVYRDVVAGVRDARDGSGSAVRSDRRWVLAIAGPLVGLILALSGGHGIVRMRPSHGARAISAAAVAAPSDPTPAGARAAVSGARTYTVRAGDRLSALAERFYGSAEDWTLLARANVGVLHEPTGARLVDPTVLREGVVLRVPEAVAGHGAPSSAVDAASMAQGPRKTARDDVVPIALSGFGVLGATLLAQSTRRRRRLQSMRLAPGARRPRMNDRDARAAADLRPLLAVELPLWIDAANRLLFEQLRDRAIAVPRVGVVRAGNDGIDFLLERAAPTAPYGFVVRDDARTWRLDPYLSLDDVVGLLPADARPLLPVLVPIGEDAHASYLFACSPGESVGIEADSEELRRALGVIAGHLADAPWSEVSVFRLGPCAFPGSASLADLDLPALADLEAGDETDALWRDGVPESQPVVLVERQALGRLVEGEGLTTVSLIGAIPDATRTVHLSHGRARVEPLGIDVPALVPAATQIELAARLRHASLVVPDAPHQPVLWPDDPATPPDVPPRGVVEVRLLRKLPDLLGADEDASADAVSFVSYLVLHDHVADPDAIGDALTRYRSTPERRAQALARAAAAARRCLGPTLLPVIAGTEPYRLSFDVTCDWLRFRDMASLARACERGGDPARAIEVYRAALELVDVGAPCSDDAVSSRYLWLDAEQLRDEIETHVVSAARDLAMLCLSGSPTPGSQATAAWAIEVGRRVDPDAKSLRDAAMFLADARADPLGLDEEFRAAVDAVDELGLGADVDPGSEAIYTGLRRALRNEHAGDAG